MLTRYFVECPHVGCGWLGFLEISPETARPRGLCVNVSVVAFQCPSCQQEWRARAIGNDVEALPLDGLDAELDPVMWPPIDLGVGD